MTAQMHEGLIYNGKRMSMAFCPPLPKGHPRLVRPKGHVDSILLSTACWRGYLGTWQVKDGKFYLRKVEGVYELDRDEPLFADWFTGVLRVPQGKRLLYVHMGFGSVHERELHVKVEKGIVTGTRTVDNRNRSLEVSSDESQMSPDELRLMLENLPGGENRFPGDDEF